MATTVDRSIALLSIHPVYADLLLDGSKRVELRRASFPKTLKHVVIYATVPVQQIVGAFSVRQVVISSPSLIWQRYGKVSGVSKQQFDQYFEGRNQATAIEVSQIMPLDKPFGLRHLGSYITPPQSVKYLSAEEFAMFKRQRSAA